MPYKVRKQDDRWCVFNTDTGENKGCSDTKEEAMAHMRALYVHADEKEKEASLVATLVTAIKSIFKPPPEEAERPDSTFMLWKERDDACPMWLALYSNNFRDNDQPPEIIAAESHKAFVEMVDKGEADYPELWLWHVPAWKFGQATWVAYDDAGFALAAGTVDNNPAALKTAEWLMGLKEDIRVSHGMPKDSITRSEEDESVIIRHKTIEISPLIVWAAANKYTGFAIIPGDGEQKESETMAIPDNKRKILTDQYGLSPDLLDALEAANTQTAKELAAAGIQQKDNQDNTSPNVETTTAPVADQSEKDNDTQDAGAVVSTEEAVPTNADATSPIERAPTIKEVTDAVEKIVIIPFSERLKTVEAAVAEIVKTIDGINERDEAKVDKRISDIPVASLAAMLAQRAVGHEAAAVDGRSALAKQKPKEAEPTAYRPTGVPLLDRLITSSDRSD